MFLRHDFPQRVIRWILDLIERMGNDSVS